jgi:cytochrome c-type biogenesis protein CcmH
MAVQARMANGEWRMDARRFAIRHWPFAIRAWLAVLTLLICLSPAQAVEPGEILKDPALEARARRLSQELRCVVCQNQSIDESNAPLAHDLRVIVRERLAAGDSDLEVLAFVEARYGAFVLLRPRLTPETLLLWLTPLLLLAGAAAYLVRARRRPAGTSPETAPLSPEEQRRLAELIRETGADPSPPTYR